MVETRREAVIVAAARTPIGKGKPTGALSGWHPVDLLATVLREVVDRGGVDPALVDDVIAGCVSQGSEQSFNVARNAVLAAGFPETVPGTTVDRQCGSSQQAVHFAAQGILAWQRETGADPARVNVNGGAIALGHPLGASGARLMTSLVHAMAERGARFGLQTMCEGGGMANATIVERLA